MLLWLASLGHINVRAATRGAKSKKIFIPHEAHSQQASALGAVDAVQSNSLFGLVEVQAPSPYDFMEVYTDSAQLQIDFWRNVLENSQLYVFEVQHACLLEQPVPLLQCSNRALRGLVVHLEPGQAERLWGVMPLKRHWTQRSVPTLALRMAPQHAFLCSKGISKYIVLPDLPHRHKIGGSRSLFLNWQLLGLGKPPPCPLSSSFEDQKLEMNKAVAQQIGDVLKTFGKTLDVSDDFDLVEYGHVLQLVRVMNNMQEQLDPVYFHKACKDLQHRAAVTSLDGQVRRKLKYKVIWLLQVLLLADCLWNSAKLKAVVSKAIELVVPPLFIKVFREALRDSALLVPHKGTLSRWRLLLDGGFMLWCREKNKAGQYLRWMMTDSSTQHGRSFQLTTMLSLKAASAQRALLCAHEQIYLWYLGGVSMTLTAQCKC